MSESNDEQLFGKMRMVQKPSYAKDFAQPSQKKKKTTPKSTSTASSSLSSDRKARNCRNSSAKFHYDEDLESDESVDEGEEYRPPLTDELTDEENEFSMNGEQNSAKSTKTRIVRQG